MGRVHKAVVWAMLGWTCGSAAPLRAEDADLRLLREPAEYTDVIDAFDGSDPFDLNVSLSYVRGSSHATIQREVADPAAADGRAASRLLDVAESTQTRNQLLLGLDVGLYRDLAFSIQIPMVLSDERVLQAPEGKNSSQLAAIEDALAAPVPGASDPNAADQHLLDLSSPLTSKTRSGVPAVRLGLAWGVTNQYRQPHLPTWVLSLGTEIGTGDTMRPCLEDASCDPGISRGTATLRVESRWSYRLGALEPFLGLAFTSEWATAARDLFEPGGDLEGLVDGRPPRRVDLNLGLSIVPWEDRMRFQRLSIDTTARGRFVSSGRDYTPLFDALGSSPSPYLTAPNYDRLVSNPADATEVPFTGITNTAAHGEFGIRAKVVMQAARYVRFGLGFGIDYTTPHLLTGADACNAAVDPGVADPRVGSCSAGIINPVHRPVIDLPGARFRLGGALASELFATATGQF